MPKLELEQAQRSSDLARAGELSYGRIPALEKQLAEAEAQSANALLREEVTEEDIAGVVARWTGIPVDRMLEGERDKLLRMEEALGKRVIGQDHAMKMIAKRIQTSRAGLDNPSKPIGVFLLAGTSGVGKTETALALAEVLYGGEQNVITINMGEYQEAHTVSSLKGSPPGYVGYEDSGALTKAVRRRPYSVVLFDEIEKAHPDVFNILLQVLDDGRLTDGHGRTIDFRNTLIVMTSNLGADALASGDEGEVSESARQSVMSAIRMHFRPEFINRIDEIVFFKRLGRGEIDHIVDIQMGHLEKLLSARKMKLDLSLDARNWLAARGYDPVYGARPLKRVIQKELQDPLARLLLEGCIADGETIHVGVEGDMLSINGVPNDFAKGRAVLN